MSLWIPDVQGRSGPLYRVIVEALADDIAAGRLSPGYRLPPHRDLAWRLKVTVGTIARAYAEAARRGLVAAEVGRGTFVTDPNSRDTTRHVHDYVASRSLELDAVIDMAINRPTGDNCAPAIAAALRRLADAPNLQQLLGYQLDTALPRYRAAGARWLAREGMTVAPERVVVTVGGQQGIVAVLSALSRPGETVLTEELTYPGLKVAAGHLDRGVEGIAMDEHGLIPEAYEQALVNRAGRVLYCMPTNQNPTVATMPLERRRAIVEIARRHDALIVEDGIYAFLAEEILPPLWALAPERSVYITSLSKAVSPGLRIGFAAVPEELSTRIAAAVSASTMMVPPPMAEIAAMLIEDGSAAQSSDRQKAEIRERIHIAAGILGARYRLPGPAMNLWLPLPPPWRADAFAAEAYRHGVVVSPAGSFATTRHVPEAVRVSISAPRDQDELRHGLRIIGQLLRGSPDTMGMTV
jgi:DNA-binding transcriptional MocR family regulator